MKVSIELINNKDKEQVVIECIEVTSDVESIKAYAQMKGDMLIGSIEGSIYQFNLDDVFYFEAIGERVFAYTKGKVFEVKNRLYEIEDAYQYKNFIRCSKSFVINLMKLESISPEINGRFVAHMMNNEKVIISRSYVPNLKKAVIGEG